jgi:DNA-binding transcriptional regulator YdaS (Cro superfamily)
MPDVYIRTLARAAEIVGGATELAFRLKVTPSHLSLWMGGLEPCPAKIFLQAVDLVLEREISAQRAPLPAEPLDDTVRSEDRGDGKHDGT